MMGHVARTTGATVTVTSSGAYSKAWWLELSYSHREQHSVSKVLEIDLKFRQGKQFLFTDYVTMKLEGVAKRAKVKGVGVRKFLGELARKRNVSAEFEEAARRHARLRLMKLKAKKQLLKI